jgi:hypothetical protein
MKKIILVLSLLALASVSRAEDNASRLALARETIAAMHADKMFDGMAAQMKQMASQQIQLSADASPEQAKKAQEFQAKVMDLSMEAAKGMINKMDQIYADVYSEAELKAMKAFFTSPEGQSMLAKQPQVMAHVMPLVQEMQRDLMPKIKALVEETKSAN